MGASRRGRHFSATNNLPTLEAAIHLNCLPHQNQHSCHRVFINSGKPPTRQKLLKNNESPQYWRVESNKVEGGPNQEEVKKNRWLPPTWYFGREGEDHPP